MAKENTAMSKFLATLGESEVLLQEITEHVENHMGADPDEVNWGHVGSAEHLRSRLTEIANFLFNREEK